MADPVVDEIKSRLDIADFVGQTVQLRKAGRHLKGLCPFHNEKTPSFYVYPDQGTFHCFGCGKGGDVFTWVQETEKLDFGEALKLLANRAGVQLPERRPAAPDPERTAAVDALQEAAAWFHDLLLRSAEGGAQLSRPARPEGGDGRTVPDRLGTRQVGCVDLAPQEERCDAGPNGGGGPRARWRARPNRPLPRARHVPHPQ